MPSFFLMIGGPPRPTLFPSPTLSRPALAGVGGIARGPPPLAPPPHQRGPHQQPPEPRLEAAPLAIALERTGEPDEQIVHRVLGVGPIEREPPCKRVEPRPRRAVELLQRLARPRPDPAGEVVGLVARHAGGVLMSERRMPPERESLRPGGTLEPPAPWLPSSLAP